MATAEEYAAWIVANEDKRGTPDFEKVAAAYRAARGGAAKEPPPIIGGADPTGSLWENITSGFGKAIVDTGRGLRQVASYAGIGDKEAIQREIDEAKRLDAPLMATGGGLTGNVAGQIGMALLPGGVAHGVGKAVTALPRLAPAGAALVNAGKAWMMPQTLAGAAGVGATQGFVQPVASDESRLTNTAVGTIGGAAVPAAITLGRAAKTVAAPFTRGGREQIAGRTLERFAKDPASITGRSTQLVPGSLPTLAEESGDIGLAQLTRTLRNNPDANALITERMIANNAARADAIRGIAGSPGQREFFAADRAAAAAPLYEAAFAQTPTLTPWVKGQYTQLAKRPSFQQAWPQAVALAKEEGLKLDPSNVVQVAHYTKLALDDMVSTATRAGDKAKARAIGGTRDQLVSLIESKDFSPAYAQARETYKAMSQPINQMDVGQALYDKLVPALSDFGPAGRTHAAAFADAVRHGDATARAALKFPGATLERTMTPQQLATINNVVGDLSRSVGAVERGATAGSPTGQNIVSQKMLEDVLKGTGLPRWLADTGAAEMLLRPVDWAYKPAQQRVMGLLGNAAVDPAEAKRLLDLARRRGMLDYAGNAIPYAAQPGAAGLLGLLELQQQ